MASRECVVWNVDGIEPLIELKPLKVDEKFAAAVADGIRGLSALDRYERRAYSKIPRRACLIRIAYRGAIQAQDAPRRDGLV